FGKDSGTATTTDVTITSATTTENASATDSTSEGSSAATSTSSSAASDSTTESSESSTTTSSTSSSTDSSTASSTDSSTDSSTASSTDSSTDSSTTTANPLTEEEQILSLLASSSELFNQSDILLTETSALYTNIDANLNLQALSLPLLESLEKIARDATRDIFLSEVNMLKGFLNTVHKIDISTNRTSVILADILQAQQQNQNIASGFAGEIGKMQESILKISQRLDDKLQLVSRILRDYVQPKVSSLKQAFDQVNASQIESLAALKDLPLIESLTGNQIVKVTSLTNQLAALNQTQESNFNTFSEAVQKWVPTDLGTLQDLLRTLSISQKRTDLAIAVCEKSSSRSYN
ncbi:hypothetical protein KR018_003930, partial [Drosophila ironensis]